MASPTQDYVGQAGNPNTQGLGRLISQYAKSPALQTWLGGIYAMANDLELLLQRIGRMLSLTDDITYTPDAGVTYPVNTNGAQGAQLQVIGRVVGVTNVVPAAGTASTPQVLSDAQFRLLIAAKIYRNFVRGGTIPQLLRAIQIVMPDLTTAAHLTLIELKGAMAVLIQVGREVQNWEAGIFAIPSGQNNLKGAVLPRPMGVTTPAYWWDTGCFTFATEADDTVLEDPTGEGFNTTESATTGIGRWPEDFA
jgi:hypothetical protein